MSYLFLPLDGATVRNFKILHIVALEYGNWKNNLTTVVILTKCHYSIEVIALLLFLSFYADIPTIFTPFSTICFCICVLQAVHVVVPLLPTPSVKYPCMGLAFSTLHCGGYRGKANGDILVMWLRHKHFADYIRYSEHECNTFFPSLSQLTDHKIIIPLKGNAVNTS